MLYGFYCSYNILAYVAPGMPVRRKIGCTPYAFDGAGIIHCVFSTSSLILIGKV